MLVNLLFANPSLALFFLIALLVVITFHEAAHAWMANRLGDPTAKMAGRLTLNPLAHLDLWGSLFLIFVGFGWGKPVPINPGNLKDPFNDEAKIALAGPLSNFLLAGLLGLLIRWLALPEVITNFLIITVALSLMLGIFNLLPIPPLDGSKLLYLILPKQWSENLEVWGMPLLFGFLFLSYLGVPILPNFIYGLASFLYNLITGRGFPL